jgi:hypothetical protein
MDKCKLLFLISVTLAWLVYLWIPKTGNFHCLEMTDVFDDQSSCPWLGVLRLCLYQVVGEEKKTDLRKEAYFVPQIFHLCFSKGEI